MNCPKLGSRKVKHQGSMQRPKCIASKKPAPHTDNYTWSGLGNGSYRQMKSVCVIIN